MTKPDEIDFIVQLILAICDFLIAETPSFDLRNFFWYFLAPLKLAHLSKIWQKSPPFPFFLKLLLSFFLNTAGRFIEELLKYFGTCRNRSDVIRSMSTCTQYSSFLLLNPQMWGSGMVSSLQDPTSPPSCRHSCWQVWPRLPPARPLHLRAPPNPFLDPKSWPKKGGRFLVKRF